MAGINSINNGTISTINGATVAFTGSWTNSATGIIDITPGSLLTTSGTWGNLAGGQVNIDGATINLGGTWTNAGVMFGINGTIFNLGGIYTVTDFYSITNDLSHTYNLQGTLDLLTTTFQPTALTGPINLDGVTMSNGTLADPLALGLPLTTNSTFNGITLAVDFTIPNARQITVNSGNFTLANGVTLTLAGTGSTTRLGFGANQSIISLGTSEIVATATVANTSIGQNVGTSTLIIGTGITIRGADLFIGEASATRAIINNGTIIANTASEVLDMAGVNSVNNGTISTINGATVAFTGSWTNSATGIIDITPGSLLTTSGTWGNLAGGQVNIDGATINLGGNWTNAGVIFGINGTIFNVAGNYSAADFYSITNDLSHTYNLQGTLDLLTTTFQPTALTGPINLDGVTMSNGTLADPLALGLPLTTNSTFNGITLAVDFTIPNARQITVNSGNFTLADGVTLTLAEPGRPRAWGLVPTRASSVWVRVRSSPRRRWPTPVLVRMWVLRR